MPDYGEMRQAIRALNERARSLDGAPCPKGSCFGTLRKLDGQFGCTECAAVQLG